MLIPSFLCLLDGSCVQLGAPFHTACAPSRHFARVGSLSLWRGTHFHATHGAPSYPPCGAVFVFVLLWQPFRLFARRFPLVVAVLM